MSINGNGDTFTIKGAKLKVSGGVQVSGSISYTDDATGFGGVTVQIDADNTTLNITAGKTSGVAKIERGTTTNITDINHANVSNNTTIHIALKNTSSNKGDFVTIGTFENDDTVKVNYTDEYVIGPGETGMLTLRKVAGVLSLFIREMFSSKATDFDTANKPFYIKDGVDYKYPLYKSTGANLVTETIGGITYYRPSSGLKVKSRPPKGLPDNSNVPTGTLKIGNNGTMTTIDYDVFNVSNSEFGAIYRGSTQKVRFALDTTNEEASGSFTDSGVNSGDAYTLYLEKIQTPSSDTTTATSITPSSPYAVFHHNTFANGGDPYGHGNITTAANNGFFYSDTSPGAYPLGTLDETPIFQQETAAGGDGSGYTSYKFSFYELTSVDHLLVAGGGGGGGDISGGGGAGGYLETKGTTISEGQRTVTVGGGGVGGVYASTTGNRSRGRNGANTSVTGLTKAIGGGGGASGHNNPDDRQAGSGGSGGGGSGGLAENGAYGAPNGTGTPGQGYAGGNSGNAWWPGGGGGAGELGYGRNGSGGGGNTVQGHGGNGKQCTITGFTNYWFAGGGGASGHGTNGPAGNGGKGGGGGGFNRHVTGYSYGSGDTFGLTNGGDGDVGTDQDSLEPPANTAGGAGGKHTGGGGGGGDHHSNRWGGNGGSGIVIIRTGDAVTTGKTTPRITGIEIESSNVSNISFTTQGTGISSIKYNVNNGSEITVPNLTSNVAHGITTIGDTFTVRGYVIDTLGNQLSSRFVKSLEYVYGYEVFTITRHANASTTLAITGNGTDNITSVYKNSGSNGWDTGFYTPTFTAPITFEFYKTAGDPNDNGISYIQIGITSTPTVAAASGNMSSNCDYYMYPHYTSNYNMGSGKGLSTTSGTAWYNNKKHYIVYKTNGDLEFWNGDDLKYSVPSWGTGKSVRFETNHHINNTDPTNRMTDLRLRRREWDGTKYIN
jgi:hypothetical protein